MSSQAWDCCKNMGLSKVMTDTRKCVHQNLVLYVSNFPIFPPWRQHSSREDDCHTVSCIYCVWAKGREEEIKLAIWWDKNFDSSGRCYNTSYVLNSIRRYVEFNEPLTNLNK